MARHAFEYQKVISYVQTVWWLILSEPEELPDEKQEEKIMGFGKTMVTLGAIAGAAYGGYYLYKKYFKQDDAEQGIEDLADVTFDYDDTAVAEETFADKIKAAAERQLNKIK